jgi:ubiquinone/menaquinone biosynthesis C-methylase UbiE
MTNQPENQYFTNPEFIQEMVRLIEQGKLFTEAMGGTLPEQQGLLRIHDVLDLACGPGEWGMKLAADFPHMHIAGVDLSQRMINYARIQAEADGLNASFQVMDITKPLDFGAASFDLVNCRFILSLMKREAWPNLLAECWRILRPGGIMRVTEYETAVTNDPILRKQLVWWGQAWMQSGHSMSLDPYYTGVTLHMKHLMQAAGFTDGKHRPTVIDFSYGQPRHKEHLENCLYALQLGADYLIKYKVANQEEIEIALQKIRAVIGQPDFCGHWLMQTIWAYKPTP